MKKNERLRKVRKELLLSQAEMAEKLAITQSLFSAMELGTRNINRRTLILLRDKFGINPDYLMEEKEPMFFHQQNTSIRDGKSNVGNVFKKSNHNILQHNEKSTVNEAYNPYATEDVKTLQMQLENCIEAKKRLEDEVEFLRGIIKQQNRS